MAAPNHPPAARSATEELLELARRHVTEGRRIVMRQRAVVHGMKAHGRETAEAERTLRLFEDSLLILEEHLSAIERAEGSGGR